MSKSFNLCVLIGNLTRDPELKSVGQNDSSLCECSLAINEDYTGADGNKKEFTSFVDFKIWGKKGEVFSEHMHKGSTVLIQGKLRQERWETQNDEKRSRIVMMVDQFKFLDSKGDYKKDPEDNQLAESDASEVPF
jgi:single-strand DNA-binding protein